MTTNTQSHNLKIFYLIISQSSGAKPGFEIYGAKYIFSNKSSCSGAEALQVPSHLLKCNNGYQAPVLRRMYCIKSPNFFENSQILSILVVNFV